MNFRPPHGRLTHRINTQLKKIHFCSLKNAHQCRHAVECRTCTDSSDNVTCWSRQECALTYCVTSLTCLTHKVAICVTYGKWCQRSLCMASAQTI